MTERSLELAGIEFIARLGKNRQAVRLLRLRHPAVKKKWCKRLKKSDVAINLLLDEVFN